MCSTLDKKLFGNVLVLVHHHHHHHHLMQMSAKCTPFHVHRNL